MQVVRGSSYRLHRRIDEIRELREKVYVAPTIGKYKVYIIDEVHMLTREAFNALLKTLEEPPAHVVFILATTEAHKLPETIISRTQHYTFKPVGAPQVIRHLEYIAKEEGITISSGALQLLADHGQGSFRDSISLLDQAGSIHDSIDETQVRTLLGIAPDGVIDELLAQLGNGTNAKDILQGLTGLYGQGLQAASIASQLAARLRQGLLSTGTELPQAASLALLRDLLEVPVSHNPSQLLEIILLQTATRATGPVTATPPAAALAAAKAAPTAPAPTITVAIAATPTPAHSPMPPSVQSSKPHTVKPAADPNTVVEPAVSEAVIKPLVVAGPAIAKAVNETLWPEVLNSIKKEYNTLYGVLRMAKPVFSSDGLELQFTFSFHQKRINEVKNRKIVADFIKQLSGKDIAVSCVVANAATAEAAAAAAASPDADLVGSISNIFGGAERLQ